MLNASKNRAVIYVRASTEHQNYSTSHQEAALRVYAAEYGFDIVDVFRDEGRSGLTLAGRAGLLALFECIRSGLAEFTTVLVYDVSRWGRFQDVDEAAIMSMLADAPASRSATVPNRFQMTDRRWPL